MTAKEQLLKETPAWSEHDAKVALQAVQREHACGSADEWGDISKAHDGTFAETMQMLAKEERVAEHDPW
ncbi:MAG TPA: hypothetical protein VMF09_04955 [Solirubrobacteraceae bacterium]|nr:hypothetical protein [Solirubrobacteraceae bacterium]